jgi:7,8-dihydroneopterin aldolase/epimerase/oxygenase
MAQLVLENMEFYAHHGHYTGENIIGGRFRVDVVIDTDITKAAASDDLADAVDYSRVYELVRTEMKQVSHLLEHLASRISYSIHAEFSHVTQVTVTVSKLNPPVGGKMDRFSVTVTK